MYAIGGDPSTSLGIGSIVSNSAASWLSLDAARDDSGGNVLPSNERAIVRSFNKRRAERALRGAHALI
jgi:hypothetical protein